MWNEQEFLAERLLKNQALSEDSGTRAIARHFVQASYRHDYCYMWDWLGFPILQMPEDVVALQEILFKCQPSVFIETGVAWGGGVALAASIMSVYNPRARVMGIDVNLRPGLLEKLNALSLPVHIDLLKASSTSSEALAWVSSTILPSDRVMVMLDSHHTHEHVLAELKLYSRFVSEGQYLIVGDTSAGELTNSTDRQRPWNTEKNPLSAVEEFITESASFEQDLDLNSKLITTFHPLGYLRKLS